MKKYPAYLLLAACSLTAIKSLGMKEDELVKSSKIMKCLEFTAFQTDTHFFNVSEYSKPSEQVVFVSKENINDVKVVTFPKAFVFSDKKEEIIYKVSNFQENEATIFSNSSPSLQVIEDKAKIQSAPVLEAKPIKMSPNQLLSRFSKEVEASAKANLEYYRRALENLDHWSAKKYYTQMQGMISNCKDHNIESLDKTLIKVESKQTAYLNKSKDLEIAYLGELEDTKKGSRAPAQQNARHVSLNK